MKVENLRGCLSLVLVPGSCHEPSPSTPDIRAHRAQEAREIYLKQSAFDLQSPGWNTLSRFDAHVLHPAVSGLPRLPRDYMTHEQSERPRSLI
jgi:hypothetical protein